jgi:hydroxymethylpyrimidine pyrophosphatase-like HAD family hydrolase
MMPKAVFFDIDGTLINGPKGPFAGDLEAIEAAVKEGHRVFLNTGRSFGNIPLAVLEVPFWSGVAAAGGTQVLLAEPAEPLSGGRRYTTIYRRTIPGDLLQAITARFLQGSQGLVFEGEEGCFAVNSPDPSLTVREPHRVEAPGDFSGPYAGARISKITIEGGISPGERDFLERDFHINAFTGYTEGILRGENKARALALILETLGIRREDSLAVGDSENDLDMIRFAGLGIAMGNACAELKAAAGAITGDCLSGGAGEALRRFVLGTA